MTNNLKLMCVMAYPCDETLGTGGILAKYAAVEVETYLVTATRGERGWLGSKEEYPGAGALGKIREAELQARQASCLIGPLKPSGITGVIFIALFLIVSL